MSETAARCSFNAVFNASDATKTDSDSDVDEYFFAASIVTAKMMVVLLRLPDATVADAAHVVADWCLRSAPHPRYDYLMRHLLALCTGLICSPLQFLALLL